MKHESFQISQLQLLPTFSFVPFPWLQSDTELEVSPLIHCDSQCPVYSCHILFSVFFFSNSWNHSFLWIIKPKSFPVFSPPTLLFSCLKLVFVLNIFAVSAYSPHPKVFCFWWIITTLNIPNRVVNGKTERWKVVASDKWAFERPSIGRFQLCPNA